MTEHQPKRVRLGLRWLFSVLFLGYVIHSVDANALWSELADFPLVILVPAILLTVMQVALSAWRWCFTVKCLGLPLAYGLAFREYYLATFLNQILPGGVLGDVNRAWRHGGVVGKGVAALHGVAIERLSGQLVLVLVVVTAFGWFFGSGRLETGAWGNGLWIVVAVVSFVVALLLVLRGGRAGYLQRLRRDVSLALLNRSVLPVQLGSSLLVLASYLGVFLCLAWGAGYLYSVESVVTIAGLSSILLLSMVIPLTVAGWGIREGAAAVFWPLIGLPAEQGVALSVGYGALVLVSSLPGAVLLFVSKPGSA